MAAYMRAVEHIQDSYVYYTRGRELSPLSQHAVAEQGQVRYR
jgi:hypothetical protein